MYKLSSYKLSKRSIRGSLNDYPVTSAMPSKSLYPDLDIPNVDLFGFMFERKDRPYPDDKGQNSFLSRTSDHWDANPVQ